MSDYPTNYTFIPSNVPYSKINETSSYSITIIILIVCCCCLIILGGGAYYYTTTQNLVNSKDNNTTPSITLSTTPSITPSTTPCIIPSTTPYIIPSTTPCIIPSTTPCIIPSTTPCTTPTKTPSNTYPKGVTIFSEPEFKGKSLFLKSNDAGDKTYYDRNYINTYWYKTRLGSFQFSKGDEFFFFFNAKDSLGRDIYAGNEETTKKMNRIFGADSNIIVTELIDVTIYTPKQYKDHWCRNTGDDIYLSHFRDYPDTKC